MKTLLPLLPALLLASSAPAQLSITYSPDNSEMTVLFTSEILLNSKQDKVEFDLSGRWRYKKCKKVNIFIRGRVADELREDTLGQTTMALEVFGKKITKQLQSNTDFTLEFRRPGRLVYRKPKVIVTSTPLPAGRLIYIDSIDMSANKYPKNPN